MPWDWYTGDLKPDNVMLATDGPRVIDFGIARVTKASRMTSTGVVIGTPGFMCPEQVRGQEVEAPGDVFSLGAVLYYAATGRAPFGEGQSIEVAFRVIPGRTRLDGDP